MSRGTRLARDLKELKAQGFGPESDEVKRLFNRFELECQANPLRDKGSMKRIMERTMHRVIGIWPDWKPEGEVIVPVAEPAAIDAEKATEVTP